MSSTSFTPDRIPQAVDQARQCLDQGRLSDAETIYRQILSIQPQNPVAMHGLALIAMRLGRHDLAADLLGKSVAVQPANPVAQLDLGNVQLALGRLDQAIETYRRVITLLPNAAIAYSNLGIALHESGQVEQSLQALQKAAELSPDMYEAHNNLGNVFKQSGKFDQAIEAYQRAISLRPDSASVHNNLATTFKDSGRIDLAIASARESLKFDPRAVSAHDNLVTFLQFDPQCDARSIFDEHRRWNEVHARPLADEIQPHANDRSPDRRLRVGYVSPDMREHSVAYFFEPLLAAHDPKNVETFCYADLQRKTFDPTTVRLHKHAHHWCNITGLGDQRIVEMIRADQIDILVDLAGHTAGNRLLVFARKPAPVQVTYLGYPNTTGMDAVDYRLTDAWADPPQMTEAFHSEQLVRLPETFLCYRPAEDAPAVWPLPASTRDGQVTFGSFNILAKINPPLVALWAEILRRTPKSRLLIKCAGLDNPGSRKLLLDLFARNEIAADRLDLRARVPSVSAHLDLYGEIDIALDTFPYHGTTTTAEALWMGVPVVTFAGTTHISRVGASIMHNVGLPQLVGSSPEEYVGIAARLAGDAQQLKSLRSEMRQRMRNSPLRDSRKFAAAIEAAYRTMWQRWCAGSPKL